MPAKTNSMKSFLEHALAVVCGIVTWFASGAWLHLNLHQLLQITTWDVVIAFLKLMQVGLAGMIGAAGGVAGKKYLFPFIEKHYRKHLNKKRKP